MTKLRKQLVLIVNNRRLPPSPCVVMDTEHLVGILGILPLLKGSNIRKSDANVHPEANR